MVQDPISLLDRLSVHLPKNTIPLLDHLNDHLLKDQNLTGQMSLLERMNIKPSAPNSVPLSLITKIKEYQSQKHSQELAHSSTRIPSSLTPKKRKLSASMLMSSIPSTTTPRINYSWSLYPKRRKQLMTQYMKSSIKSPTELNAERNQIMIPQQKNQMMLTRSFIKNPKSKSLKWDGLTQMNLPLATMMFPIRKHADSSESTTRTSPEPSFSLEPLDMHLRESPLLNGSKYSEEKPLTLTTSSRLCTVLQLLKRERHVLAIQKSALESLMQKGMLALPLSGLQLGTSPLGQLLLLSPTMLKNYASMGTLLALSLQEKSQILTPELSSSISPSEMLCKEDINTSSLIIPSISSSTQPSLCPMESKQILLQALINDRTNHMLVEVEQISVTDSTPPMDVPLQTQPANTTTFVKTAKREGMVKSNAPNRSYQDLLRSRPKYLWHNLWNPESLFTPTVAE